MGGLDCWVEDFAQISDTYCPGKRVYPASKLAITQVEMLWKIQLVYHEDMVEMNWWIWMQDEWVGDYPASLFDPNALETAATTVVLGGQVYNIADGKATLTCMGSGRFARQGSPYAA